MPVHHHIQLVVYDFDGVMTDDRAIVMDDGREAVIVSRADGLGVSLIRKMGIEQLIISTETNPVVSQRARKLNIPVIQSVEDKGAALKEYCAKRHIDLARVIYVGNDVNDLPALTIVQHPVVPSDAHRDVKSIAEVVLTAAGGDGAVRDLADLIAAGRFSR